MEKIKWTLPFLLFLQFSQLEALPRIRFRPDRRYSSFHDPKNLSLSETRQAPPSLRGNACTTRFGTGECTYVWNCWRKGGTHIGLCRERFLIGSCCKWGSSTTSVATTASTEQATTVSTTTAETLKESGSAQIVVKDSSNLNPNVPDNNFVQDDETQLVPVVPVEVPSSLDVNALTTDDIDNPSLLGTVLTDSLPVPESSQLIRGGSVTSEVPEPEAVIALTAKIDSSTSGFSGGGTSTSESETVAAETTINAGTVAGLASPEGETTTLAEAEPAAPTFEGAGTSVTAGQLNLVTTEEPIRPGMASSPILIELVDNSTTTGEGQSVSLPAQSAIDLQMTQRTEAALSSVPSVIADAVVGDESDDSPTTLAQASLFESETTAPEHLIAAVIKIVGAESVKGQTAEAISDSSSGSPTSSITSAGEVPEEFEKGGVAGQSNANSEQAEDVTDLSVSETLIPDGIVETEPLKAADESNVDIITESYVNTQDPLIFEESSTVFEPESSDNKRLPAPSAAASHGDTSEKTEQPAEAANDVPVGEIQPSSDAVVPSNDNAGISEEATQNEIQTSSETVIASSVIPEKAEEVANSASESPVNEVQTSTEMATDPETTEVYQSSVDMSNLVAEPTTLSPAPSTEVPSMSAIGAINIDQIPGLIGTPEVLQTMPPEPFNCSNDPVCIWQQLLGTDIPSSVTDNVVDVIGSVTHKPYVPSSTFSVPTMKLSTEKPKDKILSEEDQRIILLLNMKKTAEVCGRPAIGQARIVNGKQATFAQFPWQIAMYARRPLTNGDPKLKCGAVLVDHNWVVTAAHCLEGIRTADIFLRLGEFDLESDDEQFSHEDRQVSETIIHPRFKAATFENDIALLRLKQPVIYQPNIIPVCLPDGDETYAGKTGVVTGWGRLSEGGPLPSVLQKVDLPILTNNECEQMYLRAGSEQIIPEENFLCAGFKDGKQDACDGDSGGPMVLQEGDRSVLIGIVSWGIDCAAPNQPGAYTRITKYREWLDINMSRARRIRPKKIKKNH